MTAPRTPADAGSSGEGWQPVFLHALRATGNVSAAARSAGTCRSRCYEVRRRDAAFAAAWADALEEAADRLEMEAFRRAVEGVGEDRFFRGDLVGRVTRYSDRLLMFLLKARRPSTFGAARDRPSPGEQDHEARFVEELRRRMAGASEQSDPGPD